MSVNVGEIVEGKVVNIMPFGAFIELPDGKNGLVHISEVALAYVKEIKDHLTLNETVKVKIIGIDDKGKISLSIKKALQQQQNETPNARPAIRPADITWTMPSCEGLSFEDKLSKFKSDSDDRMQGLKRNFESNKRSGGYKRSGGSY